MSDWLRDYQVGSFIDSRDTMNTWCTGQVVEINHNHKYLIVHYEGWSEKWDKRFSFSSSLIAPFRKKSVLYTGQKGCALRNFVFSKEVLKEAEEKMTELPGSAYEITQFLRGHLFTLVDCLLVNDYKSPEDYNLAMKFLMRTIQFIVDWMKAYKEHFAVIYEGLGFMDSPKAALAAAWPELLFTLKRIFGQDPRTCKMLSAWNWVPSDYSFGVETKAKQSTLVLFHNYFAVRQGFSTILNLLQETEERFKAPFKFISSLPVFKVRQYLSEKFEENWVREFKSCILRRIEEISAKELKSLDKELVGQVLSMIQEFCMPDQKEDWVGYELSLSLKLLRCPYMEKQLKALVDIREIIENFDKPEESRSLIYTKEKLANWIIENKVIQTVIENSHEEMVKRTGILFIFLAKTEKLSEDILLTLWNNSQGRHDSLQIAAFQVITEISNFLNEKLQLFIWEKFLTVNPDDFNERFLNTFNDLSKSSLNLWSKSLKFLYNLSLDCNKSKNLILIYKLFEKMLISVKNDDKLHKYLMKSIQNIKKSESICQSMRLTTTIIAHGAKYKSKLSIIKNIFDFEPNLITQIVDSFNILLDSTNYSSFSIKKNIKYRLEFWKILIAEDTFQSNFDSIENLRVIFSNPILSEFSEMFYEALLNLVRLHFSEEINSSIFKTLYLNKPFEKIDEWNFKVFNELFLRVNKNSGNIKVNFNIFIARTKSELIGYDFLVSCIFNSSNLTVVEKASDLFVSLNVKLYKDVIGKKDEIWQEFFTILKSYLEKSEDHSGKALKLLKKFLEFYNKDTEAFSDNAIVYFRQVNEDYHKLQTNHLCKIRAIREKIAKFYDKESSLIMLTPAHNPEFNEKLEAVFDDVPLNCFKTPYVFNVEILQNKSDFADPVEFFSKCEEFQENLLSMLPGFSQSSSEIAWSVLEKIKLIQKFVVQMERFEVDFEEIFSSKSLHKLVYNLKIIESLMANNAWLEGFKSRGGHLKLLSIFLSHNDENKSLSLEFNTITISILRHMTSDFDQNIGIFVNKLLESLAKAGKSSDSNESSLKLVKNSMKILVSLNKSKPSEIELALKEFPLESLIIASFFECKDSKYAELIYDLLRKLSSSIHSMKTLQLKHLLELFEEAQSNCKQISFWSLFKNTIQDCEINESLNEKYLSFFDVLESRPAESSSRLQDLTLFGIIELLSTVASKISIINPAKYSYLIIHNCLFEIPTETNRLAPKCKFPSTRKSAFGLLKVICMKSQEALAQVIQYLSPQVQDPSWRSCRSADWNYHPRAHEKSETGFVGMKNLGCICYMISALQQLFFVEEFRESILELPVSKEGCEENLLYQLQYIYSALKYSDKQSVNPKGLCKSFKDWEGRPVNILEQMDVDEFINTFMDRLETQFKGTERQDIIKDLFSGLLATEIIGKNSCTHRSEVNEAFITLPVQVKNKKSLYESLEAFKEGETLEGSNAYQCDHCESKVTAIRRVCIKYLPNTLFISLRRFEFDYDTMRRLKLNDYCEFPLDLDMKDFTQEGIERLELLKEKQEAFISGKEFNKAIPEMKFNDDYYQFRLRGIIIHLGSADRGHYYSYIRDKDQWYEFNDTVVRRFDPNDIPDEAFGGEEKFMLQTSSGNTAMNKSKIKNAYILIYERKKLYKYSKEEDALKDLQFRFEKPPQVFDDVKEENEKYWRCKSSFSSEYFDFINDLSSKKDENYLKFVISFCLTVMIRSRDNSRINGCIQIIKEHLKDNRTLSDWVLEMTGFKWTLKELVMDCPVNEKRRVIVGLIHMALKQVSPEIQEIYFNRVISCLNLARKPYSYNYSQYFELLFKILKLDANLIKKYLVHQRLINYLKDIPADEGKEIPFQYSDIYLGYDKSNVPANSEYSSVATPLVFLVACLSLCISELNEDHINFLFEESTLHKFLNDGYTRHGGRVLGQFYSTLCLNSKELSLRYGNYLITGIDKTNHDKHKTYMRQLFWLFAVRGPYTVEIIDYLMIKFMKQLLENKKYPMATESSIDFLLKLSLKIKEIRDWLIKKKADYKWVDNILTDPAARGVKSRDQSRAHLIRSEAVKKMFKGTVSDSDFEDSFSDVNDENFTQGTELEYYESQMQRWLPCTVVSSDGILVNIQIENDSLKKWVDVLSDNIRRRR